MSVGRSYQSLADEGSRGSASGRAGSVGGARVGRPRDARIAVVVCAPATTPRELSREVRALDANLHDHQLARAAGRSPPARALPLGGRARVVSGRPAERDHGRTQRVGP